MSDTDNTSEQKECKTLPLAQWAFRLALSDVVLFTIAYLIMQVATPEPGERTNLAAEFFIGLTFIWLVLSVPTACLMSIISLVRVTANRKKVKGLWQAISSLLICLVFLGIAIVIFIKVRALAYRIVCASHLSGLTRGMNVYLAEHNELYPPPQNWCDLLVQHCEVSPNMFQCPSSDARIGESSYAMNINIAGKDCRNVPGDVVLFFETDYGKTEGARDGLLRDRQFYTFLEWDKSGTVNKRDGSQKVYSNRWNQCGGLEIAATKRHGRKGMNVVFCDTHCAFVKADEIACLRWRAEEPNE